MVCPIAGSRLRLRELIVARLTNAELLTAVTGHRRRTPPSEEAGLRFAFYGRMSTSSFQDVQTSRAWQRAVLEELIDGVGSVVAEFFDVGVSRRWAWRERPEAAALLTAAADTGREFDAVVVGEYERAFHGDQFREVVSKLNALGVAVWLPEAGGPVELGSPVHEALMVLLGAQAQREVARARQRVLAAMRSQARLQGRFLGGRPPYGYRLVDGGRHPNPVHGRWGRWVQVLAPDPVTAPWVRWMFAERARGRTVASLAWELNERGVVCPSGADPERNAHRSGERWIVRTVAMILENPRYTGRQVWNRSSTTGHGPGGRPGGRGSGVLRWNPSASGRSPNGSRTSHSWMTRRSSPFRACGWRSLQKTARSGATCWRGSSCAGCVADGWTGTGFMGERAIDAGTASPASSDVPTANRGASTSEKTTFSKHCHICSGGPRDLRNQVWAKAWSINSASNTCRFTTVTGVLKLDPRR